MKTPGEKAYNEDRKRAPTYPDGTRRRTWASMPQWMRDTWEKNPSPREYAPNAPASRNTREEPGHAH